MKGDFGGVLGFGFVLSFVILKGSSAKLATYGKLKVSFKKKADFAPIFQGRLIHPISISVRKSFQDDKSGWEEAEIQDDKIYEILKSD